MSEIVDAVRLDKTAFEIQPMVNTETDLNYWLQKKPQERVAAVELLRAIHFGYDPTTARLQRLLEFAERGED